MSIQSIAAMIEKQPGLIKNHFYMKGQYCALGALRPKIVKAKYSTEYIFGWTKNIYEPCYKKYGGTLGFYNKMVDINDTDYESPEKRKKAILAWLKTEEAAKLFKGA